MKLRVTPQLQFFYDDTQAKGDALDALINKAVASDRASDAEPATEQDE
jgi:ribosome-binding factor A